MPELPEVETTLRGISPHIQSKKVADAVLRQTKLRWVSLSLFGVVWPLTCLSSSTSMA